MVWYSTLTVAAIIRASDGRWGQHVPSFNTANSLRGVYSLNTCLANRPTMGTRWHSRRVVRIRKRRTWSLCRKCQPIWTVYLWERERERGRIDNLHIYFPPQKEIDSFVHRNWYVISQDLAAFPFSALCAKGKRAVTTDNIVYLRLLNGICYTNYGV